MTKFVKANFVGTEYVTYEGQFIARFKRGNRSSFLAFLVKNFTVEEYLHGLQLGIAPLTMLESKGYLLPHIKRWLKEGGYPVTVAGFKMMVADNIEKRIAYSQQKAA